MNTKLLGIYLNDHLAGSRAGWALARRMERENPDNAVGREMRTFISELMEDRGVLEAVMRELGVKRNPVKESMMWLLERVGRLKLNGRLVRYSPLSRMMELEGLSMGVMGKRALWRLLQRLARMDARLARFDFEMLATRAERQLEMLDRLRLRASDTAFVDAPVPQRLTPAPSGRGGR